MSGSRYLCHCHSRSSIILLVLVVRVDNGLLLTELELAEVVLAGLDQKSAERWQILERIQAVHGRQDPAFTEDSTAAEVLEPDEREPAPLQRYLVGEFARLGIMTADDSGRLWQI